MTLDDLQKLATGSMLFSLNRIIAPRLTNILYLLGLAAIALKAISHLFFTFKFGFGTGLWGLLEIAVYGLLSFVVLRIVCEAVIVYFKTHEDAAIAASVPRPEATLIDEVRDAIEELVEEGDMVPTPPVETKPASKPATAKKRATPRRTARRSPTK